MENTMKQKKTDEVGQQVKTGVPDDAAKQNKDRTIHLTSLEKYIIQQEAMRRFKRA